MCVAELCLELRRMLKNGDTQLQTGDFVNVVGGGGGGGGGGSGSGIFAVLV